MHWAGTAPSTRSGCTRRASDDWLPTRRACVDPSASTRWGPGRDRRRVRRAGTASRRPPSSMTATASRRSRSSRRSLPDGQPSAGEQPRRRHDAGNHRWTAWRGRTVEAHHRRHGERRPRLTGQPSAAMALRTTAATRSPHTIEREVRRAQQRARTPSAVASSGLRNLSMIAARQRVRVIDRHDTSRRRRRRDQRPRPCRQRRSRRGSRREASASSATMDIPSHREGCTTTSAATSHARTSVWFPTNRTPWSGVRHRSSLSESGPSPTRTSSAFGIALADRSTRPRSRMSCPFCGASRPTHTTVGATNPPARPDRGTLARVCRRELVQIHRVRHDRPVPSTPASSPRRRSASLTQRNTSVHRAAVRSHDSASRCVTRPPWRKDHAWGENTVGRDRRSASAAGEPSLRGMRDARSADQRCGRCGEGAVIHRCWTGRGSDSPPSARYVAPAFIAEPLSTASSCGHASATFQPRVRLVANEVSDVSTHALRCRLRHVQDADHAR